MNLPFRISGIGDQMPGFPESLHTCSSKDTRTAQNLLFFGYKLYISYDEGDAIKQFYASGKRRFNECGMLAMAGEWFLYRHRMNPDVAVKIRLVKRTESISNAR